MTGTSDGIIVIDGVETVDVSDVDTALLGLGHSYFAQTQAVLADLVKVVGMRLPVDQRELVPRVMAELRYWVLGLE